MASLGPREAVHTGELGRTQSEAENKPRKDLAGETAQSLALPLRQYVMGAHSLWHTDHRAREQNSCVPDWHAA